MSDLISRTDAIDALNKEYHGMLSDESMKIYQIKNWLSALPSAEPLVLTCDGCRHVGTYDTDFPCSGCIRREKDYYEQER